MGTTLKCDLTKETFLPNDTVAGPAEIRIKELFRFLQLTQSLVKAKTSVLNPNTIKLGFNISVKSRLLGYTALMTDSDIINS